MIIWCVVTCVWLDKQENMKLSPKKASSGIGTICYFCQCCSETLEVWRFGASVLIPWHGKWQIPCGRWRCRKSCMHPPDRACTPPTLTAGSLYTAPLPPPASQSPPSPVRPPPGGRKGTHLSFGCSSSCSLPSSGIVHDGLVSPSSCHCCVGGTSWGVRASARSSTSPPSSASPRTELSSPPRPPVSRHSQTALKERKRER